MYYLFQLAFNASWETLCLNEGYTPITQQLLCVTCFHNSRMNQTEEDYLADCYSSNAKMIMSKWLCQNDYVKMIMSKWLCQNDYVKMIMSKWLCPFCVVMRRVCKIDSIQRPCYMEHLLVEVHTILFTPFTVLGLCLLYWNIWIHW